MSIEYFDNQLYEELHKLKQASKVIIGLTGNIASGKTTVAKKLQQLHHQAIYKIVDADLIARDILQPHSQTLQMLVQTFGHEILNSDLSLNRNKLGDLVFSDEAKRQQLNAITHPIIIQQSIKQINNSSEKFILWDMPLLFELKLETFCRTIIYVHADLDTRITRIKQRNPQWSEEKITAVINSQLPFDSHLINRLTGIDFYQINNSQQSQQVLEEQILTIDQKLITQVI